MTPHQHKKKRGKQSRELISGLLLLSLREEEEEEEEKEEEKGERYQSQ
jgi:hypothetical protein